MGAHSNYISVESDFNTAIFIFISIIIGVILYYTFKIITCIIKRHYYKQFRTEQRRVEQYKKIKAQKERTYQNAINNFFCNRIDEDTVTMLTEKYVPKKPDTTPKPIVAEIVTVENHPTRDDLHVLSVNCGTDKNVQIVCGAPNVHVGLRGVLAPVGSKLPGMKKPMAQRTVAGVESFGMMCSAAELGQGDDDKNIIELNSDYKIGDEYK